MKRHALLFSISGFLLGICAPIGWTVIRLLFFYDSNQTFLGQIFFDVTKDAKHFALYSYMGIGTALVLSFLGYLIGKNGDDLQDRAHELDDLHREVASQKEIFENKYRILDSNIKSFHHISSKIQTSLNLEEILHLCAEGLHEVLGYERVNILMAQEGNLRFATTAGTDDFDRDRHFLPLNSAAGVIYKSFLERKVFLIDDIARFPEDYHLKSPYNTLTPLRSKSFIVCPIVVKGETIGVFAIDNKQSRRSLNDSDVDTIMLFADQVASAITRINLLTSIDTLTSELETTFVSFIKNRDSLSRIVNELKNSVDSVADGSAVIAAASEGVMSSVDETSTAVTEISVAIEQVSKNLDHLAGIVHHSASAMEQISRTIGNVEQNAAISHEVSNQVKSEAEKSKGIVGETINALAEIQTSVDLSYEGIRRLAEKSNRIDNIVNVINNITKRTNLLALNASIIAAQAGEYGRSFGVVADEIRNLSLQTGQSTGEITGIIEEIMTESQSAASTITATKVLVSKGVVLGNSTGQALQSIYDRAICSLDMTQQIKNATEEQTTAVSVVARSMEDISSMTSQIFTASKDQSRATKSIVKSVETIKDMAHEMVQSTSRQLNDGRRIAQNVEQVGTMTREMFDAMEERRAQSNEVVKELETMRSLTCQVV